MSQTQPEQTQPEQTQPERSRTYHWQDPAPTLTALLQEAGIDVLARMAAGELPPPPFADTIGIEGVEFEVGRAWFRLQPAEFHYNPLGTVHGGVIAMLLDSAAGCAVHSVLAAGEGYTSVDLTTKYLKPVTAGTGLVTAEGTVISRGSSTALAQARLTDERGRLLAHATSTCLIFPLNG